MTVGTQIVSREKSIGRIAVVTAGLIGGGAIAGGLAGTIGAVVYVGLHDGVRAAFEPIVLMFAYLTGAPLGAILLPLAGFTVLRCVPLWRVLSLTILCTALGGVIGLPVAGMGWLLGALTGFGLAVLWLWWEGREARRGRKR